MSCRRCSAQRCIARTDWNGPCLKKRRPSDELTDSEDEDDEDVEDKKEEQRLVGETEEEHAARMKALREQTDREIRAAERQLAERGVKYVWTVYHDGGFTPAADDKSDWPRDRAGWGYRATIRNAQSGAEIEVRDGYGPVQLDPEADTFLGCLAMSNNTAELSAVPHIMAAILTWRTRNTAPNGLQLQTGDEIGALMVYDSQYTCDQCTAPRPPGHARHVKNATVIAVCRRMLQAVTDRQVVTRWVKVKGHSEHEGNDAADERATWAQNGGAKNESNINDIMAYLRQQG